jgi:hypothetical protein
LELLTLVELHADQHAETDTFGAHVTVVHVLDVGVAFGRREVDRFVVGVAVEQLLVGFLDAVVDLGDGEAELLVEEVRVGVRPGQRRE